MRIENPRVGGSIVKVSGFGYFRLSQPEIEGSAMTIISRSRAYIIRYFLDLKPDVFKFFTADILRKN